MAKAGGDGGRRRRGGPRAPKGWRRGIGGKQGEVNGFRHNSRNNRYARVSNVVSRGNPRGRVRLFTGLGNTGMRRSERRYYGSVGSAVRAGNRWVEGGSRPPGGESF